MAIQEKQKESAGRQQEGETTANRSRGPCDDTSTFPVFVSQLSRSSSCDTQPETETAHSATTVRSSEDSTRSTSPSKGAEQPGDRSTMDIYTVWRIAKSPLKTAVTLSRGDAYVDEAVDALSRAVELSEWENSFAVYDLANP